MMYDKIMLHQFNSLVAFAKAGVDLLIEFHDCFAYGEYGDSGNHCWKPYKDDEDARLGVNKLIGAVRVAVPKGSEKHVKLAEAVALDLDLRWVSYDWLCKATARILQGVDNVNEIAEMGKTSRALKQVMSEKGLSEIHSLEELM